MKLSTSMKTLSITTLLLAASSAQAFTVVEVPEPSSFALLALGLTSLVLSRKKK